MHTTTTYLTITIINKLTINQEKRDRKNKTNSFKQFTMITRDTINVRFYAILILNYVIIK